MASASRKRLFPQASVSDSCLPDCRAQLARCQGSARWENPPASRNCSVGQVLAHAGRRCLYGNRMLHRLAKKRWPESQRSLPRTVVARDPGQAMVRNFHCRYKPHTLRSELIQEVILQLPSYCDSGMCHCPAIWEFPGGRFVRTRMKRGPVAFRPRLSTGLALLLFVALPLYA